MIEQNDEAHNYDHDHDDEPDEDEYHNENQTTDHDMNIETNGNGNGNENNNNLNLNIQTNLNDDSNGNGNGNTNANNNNSNTPSIQVNNNNENKNNLKGLSANVNDFQETLQEFEYNPIPLTVEWDAVDMIGKPSNFISQKDQLFTKLTISCVPRWEDKGFPGSPCDEGVAQLHAEVMELVKKKKIQDYRLLKNEPSQHIQSCIIQIQKPGDRFFVNVDDRTYGPYARIKITPMIDVVTKRQVSMPIRTFFPIDMS